MTSLNRVEDTLLALVGIACNTVQCDLVIWPCIFGLIIIKSENTYDYCIIIKYLLNKNSII